MQTQVQINVYCVHVSRVGSHVENTGSTCSVFDVLIHVILEKNGNCFVVNSVDC